MRPSLKPWRASITTGAVLFSAACGWAAAPGGHAAPERDAAFVDALLAPNPHPALRDKSNLYGQFVGAWNVEVTNLSVGESPRRMRGEWLFSRVNPVSNSVATMTARLVDGEIVQEGVDDEGKPFRWVFFAIERDRFRWRAKEAIDGTAWRLPQEMVVTRHH